MSGKTPKSKTVWEYRTVYASDYPDAGGLNSLGAEGWELVQIIDAKTSPSSQIPADVRFVLYLKRSSLVSLN